MRKLMQRDCDWPTQHNKTVAKFRSLTGKPRNSSTKFHCFFVNQEAERI